MCVLFICSAALKQALKIIIQYTRTTTSNNCGLVSSLTLSQTLAEIEKSTLYVHRKRYLKLDTRRNNSAREFSCLAFSLRHSRQWWTNCELGFHRGSRRRTRLPSVTRRFVFINSGEKTAVDVIICRHRELHCVTRTRAQLLFLRAIVVRNKCWIRTLRTALYIKKCRWYVVAYCNNASE